MKLRFAPASPFVRKVMVTAIELGLDQRIDRVPTLPWDPNTDLIDDNPLGKVPALVTDDGLCLFDSPVICEYLDSLHDGSKLYPASGPERWKVLRLQALGDGILDAAVLRIVESRRPEALRSADWDARQRSVVGRGLDVLEREAGDLKGETTIVHITTGCILGYLDFRFAGEDWRPGRNRLAAWYAVWAERPSMQQTVPKDPV